LLEIAPPHCEKVYFWTVGSEAVECALRLTREWGLRQDPKKSHIPTHAGDYHGWTLGAHQLSGESANKPWLHDTDTTTHAAHPLSCAAALANLQVLDEENLIDESARKGELARTKLRELQQRFPEHVCEVSDLGLLNAVHVRDPRSGEPDRELARDWIWESVKRGVMLFQTDKPTLKVCPPLVIPDDALIEGIDVLGDALAACA